MPDTGIIYYPRAARRRTLHHGQSAMGRAERRTWRDAMLNRRKKLDFGATWGSLRAYAGAVDAMASASTHRLRD